MNLSALLGFGLVAVAGVLLLVLRIARRKSPPVFRTIPAFNRFQRAIGLSVEDGSRLHFSFGRGSLTAPTSASALAALGMLRRVAERTSLSDRPPVVTSGNAVLAILTQDTLQSAYQAAGAEELFKRDTGRVSGLTPFSYVAGAIPVMRDENVSTNVILGNFGMEAALLADTAERENSFILAAADTLPAQTVLYVTAQDPLIGEELYAVGAYLEAGPAHTASLIVQDVLRWAVVLLLIVGAILAVLGVL